MALTADEKTQIINEYATHEGDTGSPRSPSTSKGTSSPVVVCSRRLQSTVTVPPSGVWVCVDN